MLLGVAFLSGTLVLGDTMRNGFDQVFTTANAGTDVIVRASTVVGSDDLEQRGTVDPAVISDVEAVPASTVVTPSITGIAQIIGSDGETARRRRTPDPRRQLDRRPCAQPVPARRGPRSARPMARS